MVPTPFNRAPEIDGPTPLKIHILENSVGVIASLTAVDPDGDSVTWSISNVDAFVIDSASDEPPASRCARRVPLLLRKKGRDGRLHPRKVWSKSRWAREDVGSVWPW